MRLILILLLFIPLLGISQEKTDTVGTIITAPIVKNNWRDDYPTHYSRNGRGGLHSNVQSITERNAIPTSLREQGMMVWVIDSAQYYILQGGLTNDFWVPETIDASSIEFPDMTVRDLHLNNRVELPEFSGNLTDQGPTSPEISSIVGTPSIVGNGIAGIVQDQDGIGITSRYLVYSTGSEYYNIPLQKQEIKTINISTPTTAAVTPENVYIKTTISDTPGSRTLTIVFPSNLSDNYIGKEYILNVSLGYTGGGSVDVYVKCGTTTLKNEYDGGPDTGDAVIIGIFKYLGSNKWGFLPMTLL